MEDESNFEKYIPQYPLPEEIQEMKRDDTVCQYCGVSYLIHNEIKKLEEKLAKCEEELDAQRGWKEEKKSLLGQIENQLSRNTKLEDKLKEETRSKKFLEGLLVTKEKDIILLTKKAEDVEKALTLCGQEKNELETNFKKTCSILKTCNESYRLLKLNLQSTRQELNNVKNIEEKQVSSIKESINTIGVVHLHEISQLQKKLTSYEATKSNLEEQIVAANAELKRVQEDNKVQSNLRHQRLEKEKELELEQFRKEQRKLQSALEQKEEMLRQQDTKLNDCMASLKTMQSNLVKVTEDYEHQLKEKKWQVEKLQADCQQAQEKLIKFQETGSQAQTLLSNTVEEMQTLKKFTGEQKQEISELKLERERLIEAHQNRIQQLRDSFFEKLKEVDAWPIKLKEQLTKQQEQFNAEKTQLWQELSESHQKDLENIQTKLETEKRSINDEKMLMIKKLQSQLSMAEDRCRQEQKKIEKQLEEERLNSSSVIKDQLSTISSLEKKINRLESELSSRLVKASEENDVSYKNKCTELQQILHLTKSEVDALEKKLEESKSELSTLHETVRRECEERLELTEALAQARTQLLSCMRTNPLPSLRSTDGKHSISPRIPSPPSSSRLLQNKMNWKDDVRCSRTVKGKNVSEEESRQRIADALRKQRSLSKTNLGEDGVT